MRLAARSDGPAARASRCSLVGLGARAADARRDSRALRHASACPAMVTYKAKGVVPDDHRVVRGRLHQRRDRAAASSSESDLLIGVGLDPVELLPRPWTYAAPIVYCGPWTCQRRAHVPFAAQPIADVADGRQRARLAACPHPTGVQPTCAAHRRRSARRFASRPPADRPARRSWTCAAARLATACRVTVDAGAHMFPATMLWPVTRAERHADLERAVDDGIRAAGGDWRGAARSRLARSSRSPATAAC